MNEADRARVWDERYDKQADKWTRHPWRQAAKWGLAVVLGILVLSVIGNAFGIINVYWGAERAKLTLKPRVQQRVYTPENAIAQIAFFHDQCEGVNAQAGIVRNNEQTYIADLRAAGYAQDPIRQQQAQGALTQDTTAIAGAKNVLLSRAADYNSRSQQSTANVFKGHGLPRRIDVPSSDSGLAEFHVNCGSGK